MKFRKLRIAWSVSWGLSCVLLVVLWVRSHFVIEGVGRASQTPIETSGFIFMSDNGTLCFISHTAATTSRIAKLQGFNDGWVYRKWPRKIATVKTFDWDRNEEGFIFRFP